MPNNTKYRTLAALPLLVIAVPSVAQDASDTTVATERTMTAWGKTIYDIPADRSVRFGTLENGLRYATMANSTPKDTAAIRLGFDVGWIDETDDELGLAHLVEHMAFNGSTNVPEGEMIRLLERLGLAFGADTNASTGFEDTIYKLDLPRTDPELIDTALMLMRETASELTIADDAVDRERGIIQSETRTRNNFQIRRLKDYLRFVAPDTRYSQRFRADGTAEIIDSASGPTVRGLYDRFYRPDNAALVVVGDIDPDEIEAKIREQFADWRAPQDSIVETEKGAVDLQRGPAARNFVDPDVPYSVVIDRFGPYEKRLPTVAQFRENLLINLGSAILNRRLQKIANGPDAPIISANASASDFFDIHRQASLTLQAKEGEWERALAVGEQEWRRAVRHGFTQAELAEQLANFETRYRDAARQQDTRRNRSLAGGILSTARREKIFIEPRTTLDLFAAYKDEISPEMVGDAFAAHYALSDPLIHVSTKSPIENAQDRILAVHRASQQVAVHPPEIEDQIDFAYSDFGPAGTVVEDTTVEDLSIRTIRFANNVRLNLKPTNFEQGRLRYAVRIGSGRLSMPSQDMASAMFLSATSSLGGVGKHSYDQLRQLLAGRRLTYGLNVGSDQFGLRSVGTMTDLPIQLKLSAAYSSDPGFRAEMLTKWLALIPPFVAQADATPQAVARFKVGEIVASGNPRFAFPSAAELEAVSLDRTRALVADQMTNAPIEISLVGDFDEQEVIDAVAASFGALPERSASLDPFEQHRTATFATDRRPRTLTHAGADDQALAVTYWPTTDDADAREEATMQLLASVMRLEMLDRIREELGASYSPGAGSNMSDIYRGYGTFSTSVIVEPERADEVFDVVDRIVSDFRSNGIDADLLDRARKPLLEKISLNRRENGWWLAVLQEAQLRPERLERIRSYEDRVRAVTPESLREAAVRYLHPDAALRIRIVPETKAG